LKEERTVLGYLRVSSSTQKDDLERQKQLVANYSKERGYGEIQIISDVGSGLNEKRKSILKLLWFPGGRYQKLSSPMRTGLRGLAGNIKGALPSFRIRDRGDKPRGENAARGTRRRPDSDSFPLCWEALRDELRQVQEGC